MPRAKSRARPSCCRDNSKGRRALLPPYLRSDPVRTIPLPKIVSSSATPRADFPFLSNLPLELRTRIWELATQERRVVAVRGTKNGLRSPVPAILHVCSESRAIGLKVYALSFGQEKGHFGSYNAFPLPAKVYFNFERDILFFRSGWNVNVENAWSCVSHFDWEVNIEDLKRVKAVGFDLNASVCHEYHKPLLSRWFGLETMYLGLERPQLSPDCEIELEELKPEDVSIFLEEYCKNRCWNQGRTEPQGTTGLEFIKNSTTWYYIGRPDGYPTELCPTLCPVQIVPL